MNKVLTIVIILLFFTMINLAINQATVQQDKQIRDSAYNFVEEKCITKEKVESWQNEVFKDLNINITPEE